MDFTSFDCFAKGVVAVFECYRFICLIFDKKLDYFRMIIGGS